MSFGPSDDRTESSIATLRQRCKCNFLTTGITNYPRHTRVSISKVGDDCGGGRGPRSAARAENARGKGAFPIDTREASGGTHRMFRDYARRSRGAPSGRTFIERTNLRARIREGVKKNCRYGVEDWRASGMGLNGCREDSGRPRGGFEGMARLDVQRAVCQEKNGEGRKGENRKVGRRLDGEGGGEGYEGTLGRDAGEGTAIRVGSRIADGLIDWPRSYCFRRRLNRRNAPRQDGRLAVQHCAAVQHPHPCSR